MIDDLARFRAPVLLFSGGEPLVRGDLLFETQVAIRRQSQDQDAEENHAQPGYLCGEQPDPRAHLPSAGAVAPR